MSQERAVIFDMDGVIIDSEQLNKDHLAQFLTNLGVDESEEKLATINLKGLNSAKTWDLLVRELQLECNPKDLIPQSRESYLRYFTSLEELPTIPGAIGLIRSLGRLGYERALASLAAPKRVDFVLSRLSLKEEFSVVVNGDSVQQSKPAPDIFLLAADQLNVHPSSCIVIEDAYTGVMAAKAAEIYRVLKTRWHSNNRRC